MCANRVMFKQFLQSGAMQYCQIDSARIGGVNEILAVYLMAYKLGGKSKLRYCAKIDGLIHFKRRSVDYPQLFVYIVLVCVCVSVSNALPLRLVPAVKVCPHAGGVGLCEMVQHLQLFDYICLSQTSEGRFIEYVDQQHEHFVNPVHVRNSHYMPPKVSRSRPPTPTPPFPLSPLRQAFSMHLLWCVLQAPGYSTELKREAAEGYEWPIGFEWQKLFASGKFQDPKHTPTLPLTTH